MVAKTARLRKQRFERDAARGRGVEGKAKPKGRSPDK
jgi:hypothetical protein